MKRVVLLCILAVVALTSVAKTVPVDTVMLNRDRFVVAGVEFGTSFLTGIKSNRLSDFLYPLRNPHGAKFDAKFHLRGAITRHFGIGMSVNVFECSGDGVYPEADRDNYLYDLEQILVNGNWSVVNFYVTPFYQWKRGRWVFNAGVGIGLTDWSHHHLDSDEPVYCRRSLDWDVYENVYMSVKDVTRFSMAPEFKVYFLLNRHMAFSATVSYSIPFGSTTLNYKAVDMETGALHNRFSEKFSPGRALSISVGCDILRFYDK